MRKNQPMRLGIPGSIGMACSTSNRVRLEYTAGEIISWTMAWGAGGSGLTIVQALQQFFDG